MRSARVSHVGVKGATCDLSELALRSQRRRVVSCGDNSVPPQDAQRQLRPRRVDGGTPRHLPSAPVHSAGSQLPLEGTERYNSAQMVKSRLCNASCGHSEMELAIMPRGLLNMFNAELRVSLLLLFVCVNTRRVQRE